MKQEATWTVNVITNGMEMNKMYDWMVAEKDQPFAQPSVSLVRKGTVY